MLSRVAENMYWFARYLERVEDTARCITVNTNLFLDLPKGYAPGWEPLLQITGLMEQYRTRHGAVNEKNTLRFQFLNFPLHHPARDQLLRQRPQHHRCLCP